ncbi:MAG TPA: hypothetical protein VK830_06370, partial [Xanthomonadales bacterium]|nr:hypothetical protein [Xanthomonadales bacterium]
TSVNSIDAGLQIETREFSALTRDPVARNIIRTLFINKRLRKFGKDQCDEKMIEFCQQAYRAEAAYMVAEGWSPALIENAARAAGMSEGPLTQAGINMAETVNQHPAGATAVNIEPLKLRLLSIQSLAALHFQDDQLSDPVAADLNSIIGWGFPAWTGGVMSYIDTMGWRAFIGQCDRLAADHGERFKVNEALRSRAEKNDRIYPAQA